MFQQGFTLHECNGNDQGGDVLTFLSSSTVCFLLDLVYCYSTVLRTVLSAKSVELNSLNLLLFCAAYVHNNHACACSVLSLDAMDVSGEQQIDIDANLFKERLNLEGTPINPDSPEKHGKYCRLPPAYFI